MKLVPNEKPQISVKHPLAIIGEAPGADEEQHGRVFIGASGNILNQALNAAGILRSTCYLGNVTQVRPPGNNITRFKWSGWQIQEGLKVLRSEIQEMDPHLVVLLGATALRAAGEVRSVNNLRGTLFECRDLNSPFYGRKCLATFHPASVLRQYSQMPLFVFDLKRAAEEKDSKILNLPEPVFDLDLLPETICERLDSWPSDKPAAIDIEGGVNEEEHGGITCMSVAESAHYAFIIDFKNMGDDKRPMIWNALDRFLRRPDIPKIAQGSSYEYFCIGWKWRIPICNLKHDTMLSGWELYPELPKALGTQASIWTRRPFYKDERKVQDDRTHHIYCCKDTTTTYEIWERHQEALAEKPEALRHYEFNMSLMPQIAYVQMRGFRYDKEAAKEERNAIGVEQDELQTRIDLFNKEPLNCNSPKQLQHTLYKRMGFEPQYKLEGGRKTNKLTTDNVALLKLLKKYDSDLVYSILKWKHLDGIRKQLDIKLDRDGRIRSSYNPVGTETGRYTCYASNTGCGYNLQTTTKRLRRLFITDEGKFMFQVDLSGADGWTVAAHAAELGDARMLEDLQFGIKPARVICALYLAETESQRREIAQMSSSQLASYLQSTDIPTWLYAAAKAVQHGSSYGMGKITMSNNILRQSWKSSGEPVYVAPKDCVHLQELFFMRYIGVRRWQTWVKMQLESKGEITAASGHTRRFFGRRTDNATLQAAYSQEPQANTTYATALAAKALWYDPENRKGNGLIIEPLHQVHDSIIGQFPKDKLQWAKDKLRSYFNNPLTIANQELIIPYEGEIGLYWGDDSQGTI